MPLDSRNSFSKHGYIWFYRHRIHKMCTLFHTMITHFVLFIFSHRHTATCYRSSQRNSFIFPVLRLSPFIFQLHAIVEMPEHVNTYFIAYFNTSSHKIDSILLYKHLNGSFESYVRSWRKYYTWIELEAQKMWDEWIWVEGLETRKPAITWRWIECKN